MGALAGVRVIEIVGVGPAPFASMMLADMGADVIRIDRPGSQPLFGELALDVLNRGKRSVTLDLKSPEGLEQLLGLLDTADVLIEGYRPGTTERLGFGPDVVLERNPRLVYGRMTGWGQEGPLADKAGHDINYISLTGTLASIGEQDQKPQIPLNIIGDFGGGGMMFAFGLVTALYEREQSGKGQVVDAAMIDGTNALMSLTRAMNDAGIWSLDRGSNFTDSGAHFYQVYACKDGKYISVGSVEPKFYEQLLDCLAFTDEEKTNLPHQMDKSQWPAMKTLFQNKFLAKTLDEWMTVFSESDCCVTPVMDMQACLDHPHHQARESFIDIDGIWQHAPAPRLSRTPGQIKHPAVTPGKHNEELLN